MQQSMPGDHGEIDTTSNGPGDEAATPPDLRDQMQALLEANRFVTLDQILELETEATPTTPPSP